MLRALHIRNLVVVEDARLEFHAGLNVLTGSTGAGKSLILGAVNLLLGHKASPDMIRAGAENAAVEAVFTGPGTSTASHSVVSANRVKVRREIRRNGRSYAFIGDDAVTIRQLGDFCARWIEPHGQNEQFRLKDAESHITYLDVLAGNESERAAVAKALESWEEATGALLTFDQRINALREKRELLEHRVTELERAGIEKGERYALERDLRVLANAERIYAALAHACASLYDEDEAAVGVIAAVTKRLGEISGLDERIDAVAGEIEAAGIALSDGVESLRTLMERLDFDPALLQNKQERLDAVYALEQRYGMQADELVAQCAAWQEELDGLVFADEERAGLAQKVAETSKALGEVAGKLSRSRRKAAKTIDERMTAALDRLMMRGAAFRTDIALNEDPRSDVKVDRTSVAVTALGADRVRFMVRTNPGEEEGGVDRIASTGEVSRIALALKELASRMSQGSVLIFDEIDAGVGADLGEVIAEKLLALSERHQIICITHMPQIAARADQHIAVVKESDSERARVHVEFLGGEERRLEVARMLGGSEGSDHRLRLAAEMLQRKGDETAQMRP